MLESMEDARGIESSPASDMNGLMTRQPSAARQTRGNPSLTDLDWAILGELTLDPHASPRLLAERLNLPVSQIASRVRNLDRRNVSHVLAVLDLKAAGQSFCFLHMSIRGRPAEEVGAKAASIPEVLMVSTLSGGAYDLMLLIRFTDTDKLYRLIYEDIAPIDGVARFFVSVVVDIPVFKSNYVNYTSSPLPMGIEENMRDLSLNYNVEEMDDLDRCIVAELQQDARRSINSISRKYDINASTIRYRIKSLENRGLMRFITVLDPPAVGLYNFSVVEIQASGNKISDIVTSLKAKSWLSQLFLCAGSSAIMTIVASENPEAMMQIKSEELSVIDGIENVQISTLVKTYKLDQRWGQRFT